jgi:hypothetical protein
MATSLIGLEAWFREELPRLNRRALTGAPPTSVAEALLPVLPQLPAPDALTVTEAQRLVIALGLAGSSVARHYQEEDPRRKQHPERAFDGLLAGPGMIAFPDYFAALAARTGTGHYQRDAYASLVIWNVPTTELRYRDSVLAVFPGVTQDHILTYTGDPAEQWFFEFVKRGQTIELGVNTLLEPLADGAVGLLSEAGRDRMRLATTLLEALRRLFLEFADTTPGRGMQPHYFMDVFRQFAAHWVTGDIPPSGALDVDALKRDFLLGTVTAPYIGHVETIMPALLSAERGDLSRRMQAPSLPDRVLAQLGLDRSGLAQLSARQIAGLVTAHPGLADWYLLLAGHARAAGAHLMLSKRFLFNPQRRRDDDGIGDRPVVSNRRGTTGMDESILDLLTRMRRDHPLAGLRPALAGVTRAVAAPSVDDVELWPEALTGWSAEPADWRADRVVAGRPGRRVADR